MPRCGRRPRIGVCDRRVSWRRGIEAQAEAEAEADAAARRASSAGRSGWRRSGGRSGVGGPGVRAPDAAVQRHAAVGLGRVHQGRLRRGEVGPGRPGGGGASETRDEPDGAAARVSASDPVGYVPYDQRLYDALMDLFRVGSAVASGRLVGRWIAAGRSCGHGSWCMRRSSCSSAARVDGRGRDRRRRSRAGRGRPAAGLRRQRGSSPWRIADGSILDQGRARRDPTVVQRVEIDRRDKGCRFPGCTYTEFTNVHHIEHWADGGADESGQPGHAVRSAPPCRPRAGVGRVGRRRRRADLHQPARAGDAVGAVADVATVVGRTVARESAPERTDASLRSGERGRWRR